MIAGRMIDGPAAKVLAVAKINLALQVAPRGPDGYHELHTVFSAVSLFDHLVCRPGAPGDIKVTVLGRQAAMVPSDGTDLAGRAAALLRDNCGRPGLGVHITLTKSIPVAGGMAGGSADAAAALVGCRELWGLEVGDDDMFALAGQLGADVPFALLGGVAEGSGRGDRLTPLPVTSQFTWVLAFADEGLSTAAVFATFDKMGGGRELTPLDAVKQALSRVNTLALGAALTNDLEPAAIKLRPELAETLAVGRQSPGARGGILSGSGPTCAFLVDSKGSAKSVAKSLEALSQVSATAIVDSPPPERWRGLG